MEGKVILFKRFADIDVFDLEINSKDPQEIVRIIECLEPTFGGINLEDIKAPECFYIEEELKSGCLFRFSMMISTEQLLSPELHF